MTLDAYSNITEFEYSELFKRFGIGSRQGLIDRVDALASKGLVVRPTKRGNKKFIKGYELKWLDDLQQHLSQDGATFANFNPGSSPSTRSVDTVAISPDSPQIEHYPQPQENLLSPLDIVELAQTIALIIRPVDRFDHYEQLERFAKFGWLISSKDLRSLIGSQLKSSVLFWGGFKLEKVKARWWKVTKECG